MNTKLLILLVLSAMPLPVSGQPPPGSDQRKKIDRIKSTDFPQVARRIDRAERREGAFEKHVNSKRVADREAVIAQIADGWRLPDQESVVLLKRMARHDPDPRVRGRAVRALHDAWVTLDLDELPSVFVGYHRDQLLDRRRKDLCDNLVQEVKRGGVEAGYAAYALGVLRCKAAAPELGNLAESSNEFVRYSAGRALIACGDAGAAAPILKTLMNHGVPPKAAIRDIVDPYYQALAARAYMELGPAQRKAGIERLIALTKELENWQDGNAPGRLETARRLLP